MPAAVRERLAVLLGVGLMGLLLWELLHGGTVKPRLAQRVSLVALLQPRVLPPPPAPPPPPPKVIRPARPMITPQSPAAPRVMAQAASRNTLAVDTPPQSDPFEIPRSIDLGDVIAGGAGGHGHGLVIGGGGASTSSECGGLHAMGYMEKLNYEVMRRFKDNPTMQQREFVASVRLWFDPGGGVLRTELENSTRDSSLDEGIAALLRTIDLKESVPDCLQPMVVHVRSPWNAKVEENPRTQSSQTLIWQEPRPK